MSVLICNNKRRLISLHYLIGAGGKEFCYGASLKRAMKKVGLGSNENLHSIQTFKEYFSLGFYSDE